MKSNNNIKEDICAQQTKIISTLRDQVKTLEEQNQQQARRIEYLQEVQREHNELMQAFGNNGNTTYSQAMSVVLTNRNQIIQRNANKINSERQGELESYRQAAHDAEVKKALDNNPHLVNDCNRRKAKIKQDKNKMVELAKRFFDLTEEQAAQYINLKHKPDESAIKHLILESTVGGDVSGGPPAYVVFECAYCQDKKYASLKDCERHIYNEGQDHRDITLKRIEEEAINDTAIANKDLQEYIDNVLQGKRNAEHRAFLEHERAEQAKLKKDLPYVSNK